MILKDLLKKDEFTIYEILDVIKKSYRKSKKSLSVTLAVLFFISLIDYALDEINYETKATVLINQSTGSIENSNVSSLLGISAINSSKNNIFGPEMYKEIVHSKAFLNILVESEIPLDKYGKKKITLERYLLSSVKKTNIQKIITSSASVDLKDNIEKKIQNSSDTNLYIKQSLTPELVFSNKVPPIVELNPTRESVINKLKDQIKLENKGNNIVVSVQMNSPFISAFLSKLVLENLINYISLYKTTKQRDNIFYLEGRLKESENEYNLALMKLANYKDQSFGVIYQSSQVKEQVFTNDINLKFNLYNQFKTQLEQAKIELKKETPLFTVLDPISIPSETSNKNYLFFSAKYFAIGFILTLSILAYNLLSKTK